MEKWRLPQVTWPLKSECSCLDTAEEYLYSEFLWKNENNFLKWPGLGLHPWSCNVYLFTLGENLPAVYQPALGHSLTQQRYRHQSIMVLLHNFQLKGIGKSNKTPTDTSCKHANQTRHPLTCLANMQQVLSPQLCFTKILPVIFLWIEENTLQNQLSWLAMQEKLGHLTV